MENYTVKIVETSRELTKKERVQLKTNSATKLEDICPINLEGINGYAVLEIHNERARDNKDYTRFIIFTESGDFYYTGSPTFKKSFMLIWEEMGDEKDWGLECVKVPTDNYPGRYFLTCNLI